MWKTLFSSRAHDKYTPVKVLEDYSCDLTHQMFETI